MKVGIMQPYFFPYIGYFQLIEAVDRFFLYDNLDYSKGGWISRNRLLVVGGQPMFWSIPIRNRNASQTIREVRVEHGDYWRKKLLRSLETNYRRAPFFSQVVGLAEETLFLDTDSLSEINQHSVLNVAQYLDIDTEILTDSTPFDALEKRLREDTAPGADSRKITRALELCRELEATTFVNPVGGRELYDRAVFEAAGLSAAFLACEAPAYPQLSRATAFHPQLSILDVLMNCSREQARTMLRDFRLV